MTTPERDTRYAEQASTLYDDLEPMFTRLRIAQEDCNLAESEEARRDIQGYLARRLYDVVQGDE